MGGRYDPPPHVSKEGGRLAEQRWSWSTALGLLIVGALLSVGILAEFLFSDADDQATAFGKPGQASAVTRTVTVTMSDDMRFAPAEIAVTEGETIRFDVKN